MKLNRQPEHLALLLDILNRHAPQAEVWAYGSRVNGTGHDGSDRTWSCAIRRVWTNRNDSTTCATRWVNVTFRCWWTSWIGRGFLKIFGAKFNEIM
jgi:hypothetical protein